MNRGEIVSMYAGLNKTATGLKLAQSDVTLCMSTQQLTKYRRCQPMPVSNVDLFKYGLGLHHSGMLRVDDNNPGDKQATISSAFNLVHLLKVSIRRPTAFLKSVYRSSVLSFPQPIHQSVYLYLHNVCVLRIL